MTEHLLAGYRENVTGNVEEASSKKMYLSGISTSKVAGLTEALRAG